MSFSVELEKGVWTLDVFGDPGRTVCKYNADKFKTKQSAEKALAKARTFRPFVDAKIIEVKGGASAK